MRPEYPGRAPKSASVASVRWLVHPGVVVRLRRSPGVSLSCLGGLAHRPISGCTLPVCGPFYSGLVLSQARPSPRHAPRLPLLLSILQRCFRSTAGAAILLYLLSCPDVGGTPSVRPGSVSSVCLSI